MALTATLYNFDIDLVDADRSVYEALALRVARHPSESEEYLVARVLAYCLEYAEGISFSSGLSDPDEPALAGRDLTGTVRVWIEIGSPDAARLHQAIKAAEAHDKEGILDAGSAINETCDACHAKYQRQ